MAGRRRRGRKGRNDEILQGVLLVDKPAGQTSRDVCEFVKHRLRLGKVGHGGTLDPFATGLLPLLLNGATRLMPFLQNEDKVYDAKVRFGIRTDTMDPTGEVTCRSDASALDAETVQEVLKGFTGDQVQTIPRFSAARVDGKRLYEYAREGEEVELPTKEVQIHSIDFAGFRVEGEIADLDIRVHCGAGTYVRALADDLGEALGVGGHLAVLRRLKTGALSVDSAITLEAIGDRAASWRDERDAVEEAEGSKVRFVPEDNARRWGEFVGEALVSVSELLGGIPTLAVPQDLIQRFQGGQPVRKAELHRMGAGDLRFQAGDRLVLSDPEGVRAIAIVKALCASESLDRREPSAIVLQVERVLR